MSVSNEHFFLALERLALALERLEDKKKEKIQVWSKGGVQSCSRPLERRDVIIDSGAGTTSAHPSQASSPLKGGTNTVLITATGAATAQVSTGPLVLQCLTTRGEPHTLRFPDALYSSEIAETLLSFGDLLDLGYLPVLEIHGGHLRTPQGDHLALHRTPTGGWLLPQHGQN